MKEADLHAMMRDAAARGSALLYTPGTSHGFRLVPVPQPGEGMTVYGCDEEEESDDEQG